MTDPRWTGWWFLAAGIAFCFSSSKGARIGGLLISGAACLMIDDDMLFWWFVPAVLVVLSTIYSALPRETRPRRRELVNEPTRPLDDENAEPGE